MDGMRNEGRSQKPLSHRQCPSAESPSLALRQGKANQRQREPVSRGMCDTDVRIDSDTHGAKFRSFPSPFADLASVCKKLTYPEFRHSPSDVRLPIHRSREWRKIQLARNHVIDRTPHVGEHLRAMHEVRYDEHGRFTGFVGIPDEVTWPVHEGSEAGPARASSFARRSSWHNPYVRPTLLILFLFNPISVGIDADTHRVSPNHHRKKIIKSIRRDDVNRIIVPQR